MKNNDIDESTVTKRDRQNFTGLSIDQMREIVSGAPCATNLFYSHKGNSGLYFKEFQDGLCFFNEQKNEWVRVGFDTMEQQEAFDGRESVKITDLRAAIAEYDATVAEVPDPKLHWYLVAYAYRNKTCSGSASFFAWYQDKAEKLTHSEISTLQETAKNYAGKNHGVDCLEVVIMAVSYLGEMTEAEFYREDNGND